MSFGELVRQHRTRNGMTMKAFAGRVRISLGYLYQVESGEAKSPSALMVARIVAELHLNPFEATALLKALREDAESDQEPSHLKAM